MPWTIAAIAITVATPMTTPRIVSAERSLLERSVSIATAMFCRTWSTKIMALLGPQRRDRVEARRARGGVDTEQHADARAQRERENDRPGRDARRQRRRC